MSKGQRKGRAEGGGRGRKIFDTETLGLGEKAAWAHGSEGAWERMLRHSGLSIAKSRNPCEMIPVNIKRQKLYRRNGMK
jgi:hypothetical protein